MFKTNNQRLGIAGLLLVLLVTTGCGDKNHMNNHSTAFNQLTVGVPKLFTLQANAHQDFSFTTSTLTGPYTFHFISQQPFKATDIMFMENSGPSISGHACANFTDRQFGCHFYDNSLNNNLTSNTSYGFSVAEAVGQSHTFVVLITADLDTKAMGTPTMPMPISIPGQYLMWMQTGKSSTFSTSPFTGTTATLTFSSLSNYIATTATLNTGYLPTSASFTVGLPGTITTIGITRISTTTAYNFTLSTPSAIPVILLMNISSP